jgi:protein-tyrosine-phosphatase
MDSKLTLFSQIISKIDRVIFKKIVKEMRKQAEEMEEVYSIYVVDDSDKLLGLLSLKKLLTTSSSTRVSDVYNSKIHYVKDTESAEEVGVLSDEKIEVPDPYYGDMNDFEKVYKMLDQACEAIAEKYNLK